jgi:hypothetical protein
MMSISLEVDYLAVSAVPNELGFSQEAWRVSALRSVVMADGSHRRPVCP